MSDSIVIIPTYNEKENIKAIIQSVMNQPILFDLLIIDDNSPDGTSQIVKDMQNSFGGRLHILERSGKLGLGTAYIFGFNWCLKNGYTYIYEMDADFSHNPVDLNRLYEAAKANAPALIIGSRYVSGVNVVNWPMSRILMSYYGSAYVRFISGIPVHDTTAGFVCYHRSILEQIDFNQIIMKGYGFQIEMKFYTWKMGYKVVEVPIIFTDRRQGTSKMSGGILKEAIFGVLGMRIRSFFTKYPKSTSA
jgi:dolichol-phosphate mannosyltransferase